MKGMSNRPYLRPPLDIVPYIIPASDLHLFSGSPGAGKTRFMAQFLTAMNTGQRFFGWDIRKPKFIGTIMSDRSFKDHQLWFNKAGFPDIHRYSYVDDYTTTGMELLDQGNKIALLEKCILKLVNPIPYDSVIFIDPISVFFGGDLNDYMRVHAHAVGIAKLALTHGITFIASTHSPKQKSDPKQQFTNWTSRALGSVGNIGFTGTQFNISKVELPGDIFHAFFHMSHQAPEGMVKLSTDPNTGLFIPYDGDHKTLDLSLECLKVLSNIPDKLSITGMELVESLKITKATIYKHLRRLLEKELIVKNEDDGSYEKTIAGVAIAPYTPLGTPS